MTTEEVLKRIENLLLTKKAVLTLIEVAEYTGLSKSHLYKLTSLGKIPHFKPEGKYIYFDRLEIEKWLLRNKVKSNDELESEASTYLTLNK